MGGLQSAAGSARGAMPPLSHALQHCHASPMRDRNNAASRSPTIFQMQDHAVSFHKSRDAPRTPLRGHHNLQQHRRKTALSGGIDWQCGALQRLQSEIAHRGFYSFKVSAADFLDPYDPRVRSKPELYEVAMNSQLSSQLSDSTIVTVGGVGSPSALRF